MKTKSIAIALMAVMLLSMTASAYVPPELKTNEKMSTYDVVIVALAEHDAGRNTPWVLDTLRVHSNHLTNSGSIRNDYTLLRQWKAKIESMRG